MMIGTRIRIRALSSSMLEMWQQETFSRFENIVIIIA